MAHPRIGEVSIAVAHHLAAGKQASLKANHRHWSADNPIEFAAYSMLLGADFHALTS